MDEWCGAHALLAVALLAEDEAVFSLEQPARFVERAFGRVDAVLTLLLVVVAVVRAAAEELGEDGVLRTTRRGKLTSALPTPTYPP